MRAWWVVALCAVVTLLLGWVVPEQRARGEEQKPAPESRRATPPQVGQTVADFALKDVEGKTVRLSDFRGRILVLEFGACT